MSGTASRYIGGLLYGPAMGVGRYNSRAVAPSAPLPVDTGGGQITTPPGPVRPPETDGTGIAINPDTGTIRPVGGTGGGGLGGMENLLLLTALGALPYLPQAVDWIGNQLGGSPAPTEVAPMLPGAPQNVPPEVVAAHELGHENGVGGQPAVTGPITSGQFQAGTPLPAGAQFITGPGGQTVTLPQGSVMGNDGVVFLPDGRFLDSTSWLDMPGAASNLPPAPLDVGGAADGFGQMGVSPGDFASVSAPAGGVAAPGAGWNTLPQTLPDDWLAGSLGETPIVGGDLATGLGGLAGGTVGSLISAQAFQNSDRPYAGVGQQAGSALGGIGAGALIGSAFGPVGAAFGALAGSLIGGMAGGAAGGAVGPEATVGRNFAGTGTFNPDGTLSFGGFGGDNGGDAAGAQAFANQFGQNLLAQAAQQGLRFNPNMAGIQFNIGGYDNPTRGGVAPGGYFYDPMMGGSPENYALRPNAGMNPYSGEQANAFTQAVLADLTARDVFTASGQGRGRDFYNSTLGADLGGYGYNTFGPNGFSGLSGFGDLLAQRQSAIGGWLGQQQAQAAAEAAARAQLDQQNRWAAANTGGISATNLLAAQNDPTMAAMLGLGGVQATENGFIFAQPGGAQVSWADSA